MTSRKTASPGEFPMQWPDADWRRKLRRRMLAWFRRHARDLPWRQAGDPYRTWVSEIMLQQTQVESVKPYYARFVVAFPNVQALASASEEDVLADLEEVGHPALTMDALM